MFRTNTCGELNKKHVGQNVTLSGWVDSIRAQGKVGFLILRDKYGKIQVFVGKDNIDKIKDLARESVVQIKGEVKERPDNQKKAEMKTGDVEVSAKEVHVLSEAQPLPLEIESATEDTRLKYRYLDLRGELLQKNLDLRNKAIFFMRKFLIEKDFNEVTTPILTKSTPEGARDFLVPSRIHKNKFYALPQSPQQYKQLLMIGSMDKYFQIAPCFRDEDARADRSPGEFYQLDMEMSFMTQDQILELTEELFVKLVKEVFPEKHFTKLPFPRITYADAMAKYGTDKPDIRKDKKDPNELGWCWVIDFPLFEPEMENGHYAPMHHMFTQPKEEHISLLDTEPGKALSYQHDLVLNGFEVGGGSVRIHDPKLQSKIFDLIGFTDEHKQYFNHMLEAFKYGTPPHGGIAPGVDRVLMVIMGLPSLRDVIAFPKNKDAKDVLMDAPAKVLPEQLKDLHIKLG